MTCYFINFYPEHYLSFSIMKYITPVLPVFWSFEYAVYADLHSNVSFFIVEELSLKKAFSPNIFLASELEK